jgi:hypothetical protein
MLVQLEGAELPKQINNYLRTLKNGLQGGTWPARVPTAWTRLYPTDVTTRVEEAGLSNA